MPGKGNAVASGAALENAVAEVGEELGLTTRRQVRVARRLWGAERHIDIVMALPDSDKSVGLECKYQGGGGSAEEKIPAIIQDIGALQVDDREGHEQSFLDEIRTFHVVPKVSSSQDLEQQLRERLNSIAAEDLAPWCKLGNIVFRATEVSDSGSQVTVTARVRGDDVAHALEGLRGEHGFRGDDARFTWSGRSRYVRTQAVESTTTSARSRTLRLRLEIIDSPRDHNLEMSMNGLTPDDLTEAALRSALLRAPNPLANQHMGFFAEMPDPFASLRTVRVSDEILRPLAELMLVDSLVGSGRASRITQFKLGVPIGGMRQLSLSWEPAARHSSEPTVFRTIEGKLRL